MLAIDGIRAILTLLMVLFIMFSSILNVILITIPLSSGLMEGLAAPVLLVWFIKMDLLFFCLMILISKSINSPGIKKLIYFTSVHPKELDLALVNHKNWMMEQLQPTI